MNKTLHFIPLNFQNKFLLEWNKKNYLTTCLILTSIFFNTTIWGQANPTTASLPFSYTGSTTVPTSMAIHRFGTTSGSIPTSRLTTDANGDLPVAGASNSGGYILEGTSGADGISILASGSQAAGAIESEISTSGKTNISVSWVSWTSLDQASYTNSIALQYRVGESGTWINVDNPSSSVYSTSTVGRSNGASYSQTLPVGAENQAIVQIRWIYWVSAGSAGARDRLGIDNISITGSSCTTPTISLVSLTNPLCNGMSNGAIDLTVSAGTIAWNDGNTNVDRTGLAAGTYTVTATDGTCSATASYTLTQPSLISITASNVGNYCDGGIVNLSAVITGGTGVYPIITWNGPNGYSASTSSANVGPVVMASSGTYTLTVVDNNGCASSANTSFNVTSFGAAGVSLSPATATCAGTSVTATASPTNGGSSPTYAWYLNNVLQSGSTASFTFTPSNGDQLYSIMTSNSGCVSGNPATSSVSTYTVNPNPVAAASITNLLCYASNDGAIDINMTNGTAPFNFAWTGGVTTEDRVLLSAGNYNVTITDANSCSSSYSYSITQPSAIIVGTLSSNSPQCLGASINLNSTTFVGGVGSLTYVWSGPNSFSATGLSASVTPPAAGNQIYVITATDANNCVATASVNVTVNAAPVATASNNGPACVGSSIQLNGGANGNASYSWNGPSGYSATSFSIPYTQNFDNLISTGSATWVDNSTITNWYSQRTGSGTTIVADPGSNTAGGLYSFGSAGNSDRSLGTLGSSNAAAGNFAHGVLLRNTSGSTVTDVKVSYTLEQWRNSAASTQSLNVYYKISSSAITDLTTNNNSSWTAVPGLTLSSPITGGSAGLLNGNLSANKVSASNISLGSISLANNQYIMIKWEDPDQTGSDHGLSIDDVSVTMFASQQNLVLSNVNSSTAGQYNITVTDANGCSASSSTNVVVNELPTATVSGSTTICSGSSTNIIVDFTGTPPFLFDFSDGTTTSTLLETSNQYVASVSPNTANTYNVFTVLDDNNCSNNGTGSATITVNQPTNTSSTIVNCNSYVWSVNGQTYTASGNYIHTYLNATNCVSADTLHLTINHSTTSSTSFTTCDTYTWMGTTYTATGNYTHTNMNASNCLNTDTLHLTINQSTSHSTTDVGCDSYTWAYNNATYSASGTYTVTSTNAAGCAYSEILVLTINHSTSNTTSHTSCDSYTWPLNNVTYTTGGTYTVTSNNAAGCSHSEILNLTINHSTTSSTSFTACDTYTWMGTTYTTSGNYTHTNMNAANCLNTDTLHLTINNSTSHSTTDIGCDSYTWAYNNVTYTTSGTYTVTTTNAAGCLHSEILLLTINHSTTSSTSMTSCDSYTWNGTTYTASGNYTHTNLNSINCLNTDTLHLTINQSTSNTTTTSGCDTYTWLYNNTSYTSSGTYTVISSNAAGCTHTENLILTINHSSSNTTTISSCDSYQWSVNNVIYTTSGTYTVTSTNAAGCIHSEILELTINHSSSHSNTATSCDSYQWLYNNVTYTTSGTYTSTSLNAAGCTHTESLVLTINHSSSHSNTATSCDSYQWLYNNVTYTASGTYTSTSLNAAGCTHTESLVLTINQSSSHINSASSCNSYTWPYNGTTYTASGTYTATSTNNAGCTNTEILVLMINYTSSHSNTATSCNSYSWGYNGLTYTASGIYTATTTNGSGCTHTETLNLTINQTTSHSNTIISCDSYIWSYNGATYTASGTYTSTSINASGCTHTETLNLTINQSTLHSNSASSCDTYNWDYNSVTYTASGTYTVTTLNAAGCVHTETLILTINHSTSNSTSITSCDSYQWTYNNVTYTSSGTYTVTSLNAAGCTHSEILNLTINHSSSNGNLTTTECDAYTWNGTTYTNSGSYTFTSTNAAGCMNTATLSLTLNHSSLNSTSASGCGSYTWSYNNATYTTSGTYTVTSTNAAGCTHSEILVLAITPNATITSNITNCGAYTWPLNGTTYTASGTYSFVSACTTQVLNLNLLATFSYSSSATSYGCYTWNVDGNTYYVSGTYTYTSTNATTGCAEQYNLNLTVIPGMKLSGRVLLQGPFDVNTGMMADSLRVLGLIPPTEPYSTLPYNKLFTANELASETVSPAVLAVTGNNAIVDWIYLELRSSSNPSTILYTKRALVQRDGDIVSSVDGTSPVFLTNVPVGSYYVSVKHRNHLGVMSASAIAFMNCSSSTVDFVNGAVNVNSSIANAPRKVVGSTNLLWSADCNNNKNVKYNGLSNDKDQVLSAVGGAGSSNATISNVYRAEDANMDGKIRYNNADNDRILIINNVGVLTPNSIISQHTPN